MAKAVPKKTQGKAKKSGLTPEMLSLLEEARRTIKITPGNGKRLEPFKPFKLEGSGPTLAKIISEGRK
jgi:hypothetical protein